MYLLSGPSGFLNGFVGPRDLLLFTGSIILDFWVVAGFKVTLFLI